MSKQEILDYLQKTPYNTNVNVVATMLDSVVPITTQISADSTDEEVPSAKAVWNQAAKYGKFKRFVGTSENHVFTLSNNTIADIYNAQASGNQLVFLYDATTSITYQVCHCFIDGDFRICILAHGAHVDFTQNDLMSNRFDDYIYVKGTSPTQTVMRLYTVKSSV